MALYSYKKRHLSPLKRIAKILSFTCIFAGLAILLWVSYPIISFEIFYTPKFTTLIKPIPNEVIKKNIVEDLSRILGTETTDYTKASVWFPKALSMKITAVSNLSSYTLDIPKLGIEKAKVVVGSEDLSKSLIHFTGPLPGNYGNPVVFGHSTLLWLYNPKDYKTIFSKLPELDFDDEILTKVDEITYRYRVFEMKIVSPDNLSALEQNSDAPYLTLVTCVPPGTFLRRLIIKARLESI